MELAGPATFHFAGINPAAFYSSGTRPATFYFAATGRLEHSEKVGIINIFSEITLKQKSSEFLQNYSKVLRESEV